MKNIEKFNKKNFPYILITPILVILVGLTLFPIAYSLILSFYKWDMETNIPIFIGFKNYIEIFTKDKFFWNGLKLTLIYTISSVSLELIIGFIIAFLINQKIKFVKIFRTFLILPMVITPVVVGLTWRIMYSPSFGLFNFFLSLFGIKGQAWIAQPKTAMLAVILTDVWQWTPFMFLMIYAGLQALPIEPYDAAMVDGASSLQVLRYITIPLLRNIIILALIFRSTEAFLTFDIIFMLTKGGPGISTQTLNIYSFYTGFNWFNLSYTAAISIIMLIVLLILIITILKTTKTSIMEVE